MSHLKERKEKQCLNCNAIIYGRFCQVCGQENVEPKETFFHLVRHFIEDVTHFDGKFFDTLRYLILRPGFLAYEYMRGRRNSYLNPIRMYVFTSAIFFLIYFSANKKEHTKNGDTTHNASSTDNKGGLFNIGDSIKANFKANFEQDHVIDSLEAVVNTLSDSINATTDTEKKEKLIARRKTIKNVLKISRSIVGNNETSLENDNHPNAHQLVANDSTKTEKYLYKASEKPAILTQKKHSDSLHKTKNTADKKQLNNTKKDLVLEEVNTEASKNEAQEFEPETVKIGGVNLVNKKDKNTDEKINDRTTVEGFLNGLANNREELLHKLPQVMFVTLPFMALMLQILYRRSKQFFYVNHIIFIINLYIGVYLLILLGMGMDYFYKTSHFGLFAFLSSIVSIGNFFYVYKSLRNFYLQSRFKTFIKCLMLYFLFFIVAIISFLLVAALPLSLSH